MITWNLDDDSQAQVLEEARQLGQGVLIKKAFNSGHRAQAETALGTVFRRFDPDVVVVGTLDPEHVRENAGAVRRALEPTS